MPILARFYGNHWYSLILVNIHQYYTITAFWWAGRDAVLLTFGKMAIFWKDFVISNELFSENVITFKITTKKKTVYAKIMKTCIREQKFICQILQSHFEII